MSDEELQAIRERAEHATPGPWESPSPVGDMVFSLTDPNTKIADCERITDAKFIAHAREDIPALLAENAALREKNASQGSTIETRGGVGLGADPEIIGELLRLEQLDMKLVEYMKEAAALREIVEAVALVNFGHVYAEFCPFCEKVFYEGEPDQHTDSCPITKARELLQKSSEEVQ